MIVNWIHWGSVRIFISAIFFCQIYEFPFRCGTLNRIKEVFTKEVKSLIYNRLWREGSMSLRRGCSSCQSGRSLQGWTTGAPWRWGRRPSSLAGSSSYSRDTWWVQSLILIYTYTYLYLYYNKSISLLILFSTVGRILGNYKSVFVPRLTFFFRWVSGNISQIHREIFHPLSFNKTRNLHRYIVNHQIIVLVMDLKI